MRRIRITQTTVSVIEVPDDLLTTEAGTVLEGVDYDKMNSYMDNEDMWQMLDDYEVDVEGVTGVFFKDLGHFEESIECKSVTWVICLYGHNIKTTIDTADIIDWSDDSDTKSGIINMLANNETSGDLWKGDNIIGTWEIN